MPWFRAPLVALVAASLSLVSWSASQVCAAPQNASPPVRAAKYTLAGKEISEGRYNAILAFNASFIDFKNSNYAKAAEKLRQSVTHDPTFAEAHCNLGLCLSKLGQPEEAMVHLLEAKRLCPERSEPWATIAGLHQSQGRLEEALTHYKDFLKRFPHDELAPKATALVRDLEKELNQAEAITKGLKPGEGVDDYFAFTTREAVTKWSADRMPLKVYIPTDSAAAIDPSYKPEFGTALREAFDEWQRKSSGRVAFTFVTGSADSDVSCQWTDDPSKVSRPSERGEAHVAFSATKGIHHVDIIILTRPFEGELKLPRNIIHAAALHEIGHSLGLMGHSPSSADVMFCSVSAASQQRELTPRDANTLIALYEPTVALQYHIHHGDSKYAQSDKIVLNNEGVDFAATGDMRKAAEKFEGALKCDPNYEPARKNLASVLNNLAIESCQQGGFNEAEPMFKRAVQLQTTETDKVKKAATLRNYAQLLQKLNRLAEAKTVRNNADALAAPLAVQSRK